MGKHSGPKNSPAAPSSSGPAAAGPGVSAATLARELGVSLDLVLELGEGKTYLSADERAAVQLAVEARMADEKLPPAAAAEIAPNYGDPVTAPHKEDLTLSRVFAWSPRLLANRANGLEVVVQVKSPRFLKAGLVLRDCVQGETCWFYYGRLPRGQGEVQLFLPTPPSP